MIDQLAAEEIAALAAAIPALEHLRALERQYREPPSRSPASRSTNTAMTGHERAAGSGQRAAYSINPGGVADAPVVQAYRRRAHPDMSGTTWSTWQRLLDIRSRLTRCCGNPECWQFSVRYVLFGVTSDLVAGSFWVRRASLARLAGNVIVVMLSVAVVNEMLERRRRWKVEVSRSSSRTASAASFGRGRWPPTPTG